MITTDTAPRALDSTIKTRQQATWASGDFAVIGTTLQVVGETLCEAVDVRAGEQVLDVAAGNGNASLAAARRFAEVTSTDYVPALLEDGRRRAAGDRLAITFREADAEALPFAEASFDVVLSTFGVMFAPDHERASGELMRVCRPGGRIGLACWTPEGFLGDLFRTIGRHVPPPAGIRSPMLWGSEPHLQTLFGPAVTRIKTARRQFMFRYRSAAHWLAVFRDFYGPTHKAFLSLEAPAQEALAREVTLVLEQRNRDGDRSLIVPGEYLEIVITR